MKFSVHHVIATVQDKLNGFHQTIQQISKTEDSNTIFMQHLNVL